MREFMTARHLDEYTSRVGSAKGHSRGKRSVKQAGPRVLVIMGTALANLISLTLRHGRSETRRTTDADEARHLLKQWRPELGRVDIDHTELSIDIIGSGRTHGHIPPLAFTPNRA